MDSDDEDSNDDEDKDSSDDDDDDDGDDEGEIDQIELSGGESGDEFSEAIAQVGPQDSDDDLSNAAPQDVEYDVGLEYDVCHFLYTSALCSHQT